ncbi:MAG TPA: tetratricopeptide repeat protein, partial [Phycisphaerae bacterium]|nr:tetratricopeptide repeat protein [Phycisphaerae bacterium]
GRFNQAAAAFHRALDLKPDYVQAYFNLGSTLRISGRVDEAIVAYRAALKIKPDYAEAHNNLGNALQIQGDFEAAIAEYRLALQFLPELAEAYNNMGSALHHIGQIEAAITACTRAIEIKPDYIDAYNNLGNALQARGRLDEAATTYRKILQLKPDYAEAYNNLGITLIELGQLDEATSAFDAALKIKPEYAEAHNNRGHALKDMGRHDSAAAAYQNALKLKPDYADAHSNLLLEMHYHPDYQAKEIYQESLQWNRLHVEPLKNNLSRHMNNRNPNRRLKVGYVSGDLRKHPVGYFMENLFSQHDSSELEIFCYADQYHKDEISRRLQGYAHRWENISGKKNELVAQMIREDKIDILVDLAGHTAHNRLLVFALKPAPVQVTYLGYPDTTGLSTMDYRFTDAYADPPGMNDEYNVETLFRLNPTFLCYRPLDNMPAAGPPPVIKNSGKITFGSFNALMKINMRIVAVWARILQRLPESRMLIKSHGLSDAAARRSLLDMFASHG